MFPVIYLKSNGGNTVTQWRLVKAETPDEQAEWNGLSADKWGNIELDEARYEPYDHQVPATEAEFLVLYKAAQEKQLQERTLCIVQQTENAKQAERLTETTL
jgi:hypothetical protein